MKVATRTDDNSQPRFKWVFFQLDRRWELREVGETGAYATVFTNSSDIHRSARKAGYRYMLYVRGLVSGPVASCREPEDAKKLGEELAAEEMATKNSVAWAASKPAREAARRAEYAVREAREAAERIERRKRQVMIADALRGYLAEHAAGGRTEEDMNLARTMLDEFVAILSKEAV